MISNIAIIDQGEEMDTVPYGAAAINRRTGELQLAITRKQIKTVDTHAHKVILKENGCTVLFDRGTARAVR